MEHQGVGSLRPVLRYSQMTAKQLIIQDFRIRILQIERLKFELVFTSETRTTRRLLESKLTCGIPNMELVDDTEEQTRGQKSRKKRVVGGIPANPVS